MADQHDSLTALCAIHPCHHVFHRAAAQFGTESEKAVDTAVAGKPVTRKARGKILRAVNTILTSKKASAVEMKALFEGAEMRKGKAAGKKEDASKK
jgi:hypothetical protein